MRAARFLLFVMAFMPAACSTGDVELERRVHKRLGPEHADVRVSVNRQVVRLSGFVSSASERAQIEEAVRSVDGVRGVDEQLLVRQPPSLTADTQDSVEAASIASDLTAAGYPQLQVEVHAGVVHVRGQVAAHRHADAMRIVRKAAPKGRIKDETTPP